MPTKYIVFIVCVLIPTIAKVSCERQNTTARPQIRMEVINCGADEIDRIIDLFYESTSTEDSGLATQELVERYDGFYELVKRGCTRVGTFGDHLQMDSDFVSSRWVDPTRIVTVVSSNYITPAAVEAISQSISRSKVLFAVDFDSIGGRVVLFSDGRIYRQQMPTHRE